VYIYIYIYIYICVYIYIYIYRHTHTHTHTHIYIYIYILCIYAYIYTNIYTHIYYGDTHPHTHTHTYTLDTHTHTHTHTLCTCTHTHTSLTHIMHMHPHPHTHILDITSCTCTAPTHTHTQRTHTLIWRKEKEKGEEKLTQSRVPSQPRSSKKKEIYSNLHTSSWTKTKSEIQTIKNTWKTIFRGKQKLNFIQKFNKVYKCYDELKFSSFFKNKDRDMANHMVKNSMEHKKKNKKGQGIPGTSAGSGWRYSRKHRWWWRQPTSELVLGESSFWAKKITVTKKSPFRHFDNHDYIFNPSYDPKMTYRSFSFLYSFPT